MSDLIYSAIETVLTKIKQEYPRDFARLRKRVDKIIIKNISAHGYFSQDDYQIKEEFEFLYEDPEFWEAKGNINIHKDIFKKHKYKNDPYVDVLHTIAHEFGHAMASEKMFNQYFKQLFITLALNYSHEWEDEPNFLATLNVAESLYVQENIANFYATKWGFPTEREREWFGANTVALIRCRDDLVVEIKVDGKYKFKNSYIVHREWKVSDLKKYKHIKHSLHTIKLLLDINGLNKILW
jgi:hypothetical protein